MGAPGSHVEFHANVPTRDLSVGHSYDNLTSRSGARAAESLV